jgi:nucleoside-diphosphate-sugar epimerase
VSGPAPVSWADLFGSFEPLVGRPTVAVLPDHELSALVAAAEVGAPAVRWPPVPGRAQRVPAAIARRVRPGAVAPPARRWLVLPSAKELAHRAVDEPVSLVETEAALGWRPVVSFDEAVRRTTAYLRWADPA